VIRTPAVVSAIRAALEPADAVLPASVDRATVLREAADDCDEAGAAYTAQALNDHAGGAFALMEHFLRKANEAEYVATPCSVGGCEPGGEPCSTHERLMAHGEGDHELCGDECRTTEGELRRVAAETRTDNQTQGAAPHVCDNCDGIDPDSCLFNPDRPKRPPMDPVHILGIGADEEPAAAQQPALRHVGGVAEDCPACNAQGIDTLSYPWECPGPEQPAAGAQQPKETRP
jgi:hypothetical protein